MYDSSVGEKYPNPSHISALDLVTSKLSGRDRYVRRKTQMLCLLDSHDMVGIINGKLENTQTSVITKRSDALVKGWNLGSLSEDTVWPLMVPIIEATSQDEYHVSFFQDASWSANEDGHNIIQYAVRNRSEKVYNLLYQMSAQKSVHRTIKDSFGNNLLHLAARLAPTNKLNLISG